MSRGFLAAAALAALHAPGAGPAVAQDTANGFVVRHEVHVGASQARVYAALLDIGQWWNPQHTFSGDAGNLSLDARPGGCFCEGLPGGGGVEHLRVVHVAPGQLLRMSGGLGPLQASGVAGSLTWSLTSAPEGAVVDLTYVVGGFMEGGLERIGPAVSAVLEEQVHRLKRFVETGSPDEGDRG